MLKAQSSEFEEEELCGESGCGPGKQSISVQRHELRSHVKTMVSWLVALQIQQRAVLPFPGSSELRGMFPPSPKTRKPEQF